MRSKVRRMWRVAGDGSGDFRQAVAAADPDVRFRFVGDTPLGADLRGREAFADWFRWAGELIPGMRLTLTDVVVKGWPWNTTVVVRLAVAATLADGSAYENEGVQWARIRWGRMTEDMVLEDTLRLDEACRRQRSPASAGGPGVLTPGR